MIRSIISALLLATLQLTSASISAKEICKVSMMGRVCFEEGSEQATADHMKGGAKGSKIVTGSSGSKVATK